MKHTIIRMSLGVMAVLLLFAFGSTEAEALCVRCNGTQSCQQGGGTCCCKVNCEGGPGGVTCTCNNYCTAGACACSGTNCDSCTSDAGGPGLRVASLGASGQVFAQVLQEDIGFRYDELIHQNVRQESLLVASILNSITRRCKTNERITLKNRDSQAFSGFGNERAGDFPYEAKMSVRDHNLTLDLVLQPDGKRKEVKTIHAEVNDETGYVLVVEN